MSELTQAKPERPRRKKDRSVRIARTRVGKGVFAQRKYRDYEVIGEIQGEVIDDPSYGSDTCFDMGSGKVLEPSAPFRFVNHSCDPNCEFSFMTTVAASDPCPSRRQLFLLATREIKNGEELTIDYNWTLNAAIPCRCGSADCRGWIVTTSQLPDLLAKLAGNPV